MTGAGSTANPAAIQISIFPPLFGHRAQPAANRPTRRIQAEFFPVETRPLEPGPQTPEPGVGQRARRPFQRHAPFRTFSWLYFDEDLRFH